MERKSLKRKGLDLNYCDFNVATMEDTKGGFLLDESQPEPESNVGTGKMPTIGIGCEICSSIDLDFKMEEHYGVQVCLKCVKDEPDKYSLLTKTEVKADYLLTESIF